MRYYVAHLLDQEKKDKKRELEERIENFEDFENELDQLFNYTL